MSEAIAAYRNVSASDEYVRLERMRSKARHDEAQALYNAQRQRDEHWQGVLAEKDALIAELQSQIKKQTD